MSWIDGRLKIGIGPAMRIEWSWDPWDRTNSISAAISHHLSQTLGPLGLRPWDLLRRWWATQTFSEWWTFGRLRNLRSRVESPEPTLSVILCSNRIFGYRMHVYYSISINIYYNVCVCIHLYYVYIIVYIQNIFTETSSRFRRVPRRRDANPEWRSPRPSHP